ncbi:hypothetical protein amrb99_37100 [Actinomadura sp. RB99]|uniref:M50 family metallopeptidase n=1 Tax=Actinomadura sp. RB99 TaxID=2691577 RepID=UPI001688C838|nr:M50 family metallopeptidase [Actinomadura sp. RB99]MBD2894782.1 hypothetical protein [Actinomadura sp. RB99]
MSRMATAWHEAGHAVMCHMVRGHFRYITLRPRGKKAGTNGHVYGVRTPGRLAMVYVLMAGPVVQSAIEGRPVVDVLTSTGCRDLLKAADIVERTPGIDLWETVLAVDKVLAVSTRLRAVETIANALQDQTRALTYREFLALLGEGDK